MSFLANGDEKFGLKKINRVKGMFSISAASFLKRTFFASDLIAISPVLNIT